MREVVGEVKINHSGEMIPNPPCETSRTAEENNFGVSKEDLFEIHIVQISSGLEMEYCVPAWNSSLTDEDIPEL